MASKNTKATSAATATTKKSFFSKLKPKSLFSVAKTVLALAGAKVLILDPIADRTKTGHTWDQAKETVKTAAAAATDKFKQSPVGAAVTVGVESIKNTVTTSNYVNDKAAYASALAEHPAEVQQAYTVPAPAPAPAAYTAPAVTEAPTAPAAQPASNRDGLDGYLSTLQQSFDDDMSLE